LYPFRLILPGPKGCDLGELIAAGKPLLPTDQRRAMGKAARAVAPRSSHGTWAPSPQRPDPISLLEEQAVTRVPGLVPIRYGRMLTSPLAFYRGAALIMAADLEGAPRSGFDAQLCGDAHLSNFGLFGTPERQLIFDVNDFDETLPGPWEWDLKRLAASLEILGRERGFAPDDRRSIVSSCVQEYRERMHRAAAMSTLEAWYADLNVERLLARVRAEAGVGRLSKKEVRAAERRVEQAFTRDSVRVFARRTGTVDGEPRIVADPPLIVPVEEFVEPGSEWEEANAMITRLIRSYRKTLIHDHHHPIEDFRVVHSARKVVGVGSVGTRCYILLLLGGDNNDPLFLQVKEAQASVLERFLGKSVFSQHGERVVVGQRLMQSASDIFLGWQRVKGLDGVAREYYVRQFHDWKGGVDVERLRPGSAALYGRVCGATLARAHARSGDRIAISAYLGRGEVFDRAIADFSFAYADQNDRDYELFVKAVRTGRIAALTGI
jgi:uncharacterized protein (DUF2252 family)